MRVSLINQLLSPARVLAWWILNMQRDGDGCGVVAPVKPRPEMGARA